MIDLKQYVKELKIRHQVESKQVWDPARQQWVNFTPEEMIRQCIILHLTQALSYPVKRISVEKSFNYYDRKKRYDVVVYDQKADPFILIECKRPEEALSIKSIEQVSVYDQMINGQYIWITNGHQHLIMHKIEDQYHQAYEIPAYLGTL